MTYYVDLFLVCFLPWPARPADAQSKKICGHIPRGNERLSSQRRESVLGKFEVGRIESDQLIIELAPWSHIFEELDMLRILLRGIGGVVGYEVIASNLALSASEDHSCGPTHTEAERRDSYRSVGLKVFT